MRRPPAHLTPAGYDEALYTQLIKNYGNIDAANTIKYITAIVQTGASVRVLPGGNGAQETCRWPSTTCKT